MKRGSLLIVIVLLTQLLLIECGCCEDPDTICVEFVEIESSHRAYQNDEIVDLFTDTIPANSYVLGIVFRNEELFCQQAGKNIQFMNTAHATSCPRDQYIYDDRILSFEIRTTGEWNSEGDSIVTDQFSGEFSLTELNESIDFGYSYLRNDYLLTNVPETESEHEFIFSYVLESGMILSDTTQMVVLSL